MASPGEFGLNDTLASADMNALPGGVLGYAEITANSSGVTTETPISGLSVTVDVVAGRRIRITGSGEVIINGSGDRAIGDIQQDGTDVNRWADFTAPAASSIWAFGGSAVVTPSAGSHTYRLTLRRESGTTSTVGVIAGSGRPAFILVEDIGPA